MRIPSAFPARPLFAAALCALCSSGLRAQEFSLLAGPLVSKDEDTYSWQATYREGLGRHAAWSFSWLNEGHIPNHHRDGQVVQLWGRLPLRENRLELSAGAGPYRYFDTVAAEAGGNYSDTHGWGLVLSLRAAYYFDNRWIAQLQLNHVQAYRGPDTTAILFGLGYQLEAPGGPGPRERAEVRSSKVTGDELTLMLGRSILNSFESETSSAAGLEVRHGLDRYVDLSASYLHEAGRTHSRRDGLAAQVWLTRAFFDDRLALSAGVGPYVAISQNDDLAARRTGDGRVSGLVSVSASYRFDARWLVRLTWNRVATRYDRDADLLMAGVGMRF